LPTAASIATATWASAACPTRVAEGYIPGFGGEEFAELVRDDNELRAWIAEGGVARLRNDPLASYFIERQRIQMPAYKDRLTAEEIDALVAYVRWLRAGSGSGRRSTSEGSELARRRLIAGAQYRGSRRSRHRRS
jgi:hypothetical protein